jgi:hypothetical protein
LWKLFRDFKYIYICKRKKYICKNNIYRFRGILFMKSQCRSNFVFRTNDSKVLNFFYPKWFLSFSVNFVTVSGFLNSTKKLNLWVSEKGKRVRWVWRQLRVLERVLAQKLRKKALVILTILSAILSSWYYRKPVFSARFRQMS